MCVSPKTVVITHRDGRKTEEVVPCGKCHECAKKAQNDFAILSYEESRNYLHMLHVVLTYDWKGLPFELHYKAYSRSSGELLAEWTSPAHSHILPKLRRIEKLAYDMKETPCRILDPYILSDVDLVGRHDFRGDLPNGLYDPDLVFEVSFMPSLCRNDVRLAIKRFRVRWARKFGYYPKFSYAHFGEYGHKNGRPHMHLMVYGFTLDQFRLFIDDWKKKKGNAFCEKEISSFNRDGSDGRWLAALYVAKYVSKALAEQYKFESDHHVQKPRRVTTKRFGFSSNFENIEAHFLGFESLGYYDPKSLFYNYDESDLRMFKLLEHRFNNILELTINRGYLIHGLEYGLPKKYKYEILYTKDDDGCFVPTALQRARSQFIRDKFREDDQRLRQEYRSSHPEGTFAEETAFVNARLQADRQAREDVAERRYRQSIEGRKAF